MLIGHQKQWEFLKKSFELNKVPHALLFFGPSSVGKKTVALEFIKLLNCQNPDFNQRPCQNCFSCQTFQKKQRPDLVLIEPSLLNLDFSSVGKVSIEISQIRELIWKLSLKPHSSLFKTAVIDQAHLMNQQSQNCLLKILEEPKGKALLILITEYPEMLFPTLLSRVQKLRFFPVENRIIKDNLAKYNLSENKIKEIITFSHGRPGLSLNFLYEPEKLENQKKSISDLQKLVNSSFGVRFEYAKDLSQKPGELKEILENWLFYFRNVFLEKIKANYEPELLNLAPNHYSVLRAKRVIRTLLRTIFLVSNTNVNLRLALELLLMEF